MQGSSLVARGVAGLLGAMVLWPVGAAYGGREDGPPVPRGTTCADVLDGDEGWELKQETDPADGSEVHGGHDIAVLMNWDATDFADRPLFNTFACVTVDGQLDPALSLVEDAPPNDGEFTHNFTIPGGMAAGTEVCSRGAVVGDGDGYFELNPSNDVCFHVVEAPAPPDACAPESSEEIPAPPDSCTPEVCAPGSSGETPPGPPDACAPVSEPPPTPPAEEPPTPTPPAEEPPTPTVAPSPAPETPPVVAGATEERPAAAVEPATEVAPTAELPRTGVTARAVLVPAGVLLAFGGAAMIGTVKRPVRMRAGTRRGRRL